MQKTCFSIFFRFACKFRLKMFPIDPFVGELSEGLVGTEEAEANLEQVAVEGPAEEQVVVGGCCGAGWWGGCWGIG